MKLRRYEFVLLALSLLVALGIFAAIVFSTQIG